MASDGVGLNGEVRIDIVEETEGNSDGPQGGNVRVTVNMFVFPPPHNVPPQRDEDAALKRFMEVMTLGSTLFTAVVTLGGTNLSTAFTKSPVTTLLFVVIAIAAFLLSMFITSIGSGAQAVGWTGHFRQLLDVLLGRRGLQLARLAWASIAWIIILFLGYWLIKPLLPSN